MVKSDGLKRKWEFWEGYNWWNGSISIKYSLVFSKFYTNNIRKEILLWNESRRLYIITDIGIEKIEAGRISKTEFQKKHYSKKDWESRDSNFNVW